MEPRKLLSMLMESRHLNPNSLAEKLKHATTQSQIHRFETGKTREPKQATLRPVADYFGVPIEAFYSEEVAETIANRLTRSKTFFDAVTAGGGGDAPDIGPMEYTSLPVGKAKITRAEPPSDDTERRLTRFLAVLFQIPESERAAALIAATETLLDRLPPPPK